MSSSYIAFCWIEVSHNFTQEEKDFIDDRIKDMKDDSDLREDTLERGERDYSFELSGTNGIDYSNLEKIRDFLKDNHKDLQIQSSEYVETGDNFWFGQGKFE